MGDVVKLTIPEAAERFKVGETTIRRLISSRKLTAERVRQGKRTVLYVEDRAVRAALGTGERSLVGAGSLLRRRGRGGTEAAPERDELVAVLKDEVVRLKDDLGKRDREVQEARDENRRLREKVEALNSELLALARGEGRGVRGFLTGVVSAIRGGKG
jgi:excisionase family DNA binding protein